jgi:hypothetical protein
LPDGIVGAVVSLYSATLRGLSVGDPIGPYPFDLVPDGLGNPEIPEPPRARVPGADGAVPTGPDTYGPRLLVLQVRVLAVDRAHLRALENDLRVAWSAERGDLVPLTLRFDGFTSEWRGRPRSCLIVSDHRVHGLASIARLEFEALDPYSYTAGGSVVLHLASDPGLGGAEFPAVFPFVFLGPSLSLVDTADVVAGGNAPARWVAVIAGQVSAPAITVAGRRVTYAGNVPAGGALVLDSRSKTAHVDGMPVVVALTSQWGELTPGEPTSISYAAASTATGSAATITWEDRWL